MGGSTATRGVVDLPISSIVLDPRAWPRTSRAEDRVALFANLYEEHGSHALPAVEICVQGDESVCSDGFHRWLAAEIAGLDELPTSLIEVPEGEDLVKFAFLRAVRASTKGHRELTRAERGAAIRRLTEETDPSDAEIAELIGVTRSTVWRQRQRVANATTEPSQEAGDEYFATVTAHEVAVRLFRGIEKVYSARGLGLWDALTSDHTGERLAAVIREAYGDDAAGRARQFQGWIEQAGALLDGQQP